MCVCLHVLIRSFQVPLAPSANQPTKELSSPSRVGGGMQAKSSLTRHTEQVHTASNWICDVDHSLSGTRTVNRASNNCPTSNKLPSFCKVCSFLCTISLALPNPWPQFISASEHSIFVPKVDESLSLLISNSISISFVFDNDKHWACW